MSPSAPDRAEALELVANTLLGRAARLTRLLMRSGAHKLSRTEVGVLSTLSDGPRRITELAQTEALAQPTVTQLIDKLAQTEALAQPTVTQLIDKLEGRGLVTRARSGEDARVVMVGVTPAGTEVFEEVRAEIRANMREALAGLADAELTELVHASQTLGALIETLLPARDA